MLYPILLDVIPPPLPPPRMSLIPFQKIKGTVLILTEIKLSP